jgi:hypothetical protein
MRYWLRTHLTYANVMVTILAFIVLTGGTAVALNGTDTVQSDDLGPGAQVKAPDVADNAVNSADVAADSLNGADILESSLTGDMRKLSYSVGASSANPPPKTTLPTAGPYTIKAQCYIDFSADVHVRLYANAPAGTQNSLMEPDGVQTTQTTGTSPGGPPSPRTLMRSSSTSPGEQAASSAEAGPRCCARTRVSWSRLISTRSQTPDSGNRAASSTAPLQGRPSDQIEARGGIAREILRGRCRRRKPAWIT